ncbi:MAG TPA: sorbosone dehydrogenase family protein [Flavisolibacter sp.]|nr:sorbosone dehydrogenase family protein [Flavisolibacter sp.]
MKQHIRLLSTPALLLLCLAGVYSSCKNKDETTTPHPSSSTITSGDSALNKKYHLDKIQLPQGFAISTFAEVPGARSMTLSPAGTLFVGSMGDKVYAVVDKDKNGLADKVYTIASGLNSPNGVAFKDGALYVADINRILRFDNIEAQLENPPKYTVVYDKYPTDRHHGWKFIAFGPDGKLYVPVGAPCNVCQSEPVYASLTRMNADGSNWEIFARGIRNTVGFDWNPQSKELWFTDNGRDNLGDDIPSDELNHAPQAGMNFGFPFCHQGDILDPEFGQGKNCTDFTPPSLKLGAHVAALGLRFYTGNSFPDAYRSGAFVAEHGSWNRTAPVGYRVVHISMQNGKAVKDEVFASGWLQQNGDVLGRPVDVQPTPDGALLVSDDKAGAVYRIRYAK